MRKRFLCVALALVISIGQVVAVGAAREDELKEEKAKTSSQLSATYDKISSLESQTKALKAEINDMDKDLVEIMAQIGLLEDELVQKEAEIVKTKEDLAVAEKNRDEQYEAMKQRIQYLYEKGGDTAWAQMLLEADSITSMLNKAEYTQQLYEYDRESLNAYVQVVQEVTDLGAQLESDKADLEAMQDEYQQQQTTLENTLAQKKATASDYESQISNAQAQANKYKELLEQQTAEIKKIEEEKRKAAEEAARKAAAEEAARKAAAAEAAKQEEETKSTTKKAASTKNTTSDEESSSTEGKSSSSKSNSSESSTTNNNSSSSSSKEDNTSSKESTSSKENTSSSKDDDEDDSSSKKDTSASEVSYSGRGQAVVNYATQFVGNPYVWGGTSLTNGADCSGFTMSVFAKFGVSLPHSSAAQASAGVGVSYADAKPGDLICYSGHVAIYMGGGSIVHASNAKDGIKISGNAAYRTIVAVRRVI